MSERLLPSRPATLLGRAPKAGPDPVCCYRLVKRSAYKNTNTTGRTATLCDVLRAAPAASDKVEPSRRREGLSFGHHAERNEQR